MFTEGKLTERMTATAYTEGGKINGKDNRGHHICPGSRTEYRKLVIDIQPVSKCTCETPYLLETSSCIKDQIEMKVEIF